MFFFFFFFFFQGLIGTKKTVNPSFAEHDMPLANSVDPDQLASEEVIKYVNFYQKPGSSNWLETRSGRGILIYSARQGLNAALVQAMSRNMRKRNSGHVCSTKT